VDHHNGAFVGIDTSKLRNAGREWAEREKRYQTAETVSDVIRAISRK
jgi:hypothetical protein